MHTTWAQVHVNSQVFTLAGAQFGLAATAFIDVSAKAM